MTMAIPQLCFPNFKSFCFLPDFTDQIPKYMHFSIENTFLKLEVAVLGAEMKSLLLLRENRQVLWQADPDFWPRTAPVLFPVVGKLVDDQYLHHGYPYPLSQHGFARDRMFSLVSHQPDKLVFLLKSDYETGKFYPFDFELYISYTLRQNAVEVGYRVVNSGDQILYFSIGAHPGFSLPDFPAKPYFLTFNRRENALTFPLKGGLLEKLPTKKVFENENQIHLDDQSFLQDALVFNGLHSNQIEVSDQSGKILLRFFADGFPWFGIWSKPGAPFLCLEPWFGHADFVGQPVEISEKDAIQKVSQGGEFLCSYVIEIP